MPSTATARPFSEVLRETGALLDGHFHLSSGLHSDRYFQCARLLQHPRRSEDACRELAGRLDVAVDVVVGPALGGVIVAHEVGRALDVRALFVERKDGVMALSRGFEIAAGARVLVVDDVLTTGLSAREAADCVRTHGGEVVAFAVLVDRSGGGVDLGAPCHALEVLTATTYEPAACPMCQAGTPVEKPGSRPGGGR
jgi:orotate phosphoribosyltransferase